jgi:predicted nuclease of predicted toxin-antitoxin system
LKFKTDENLPLEAATTLRGSGFDVETVWDESLSGADDETIANSVRAEARILLTLDLDFANIRAYPPEQHPGIIVLRLKTQDKTHDHRLSAAGRGCIGGAEPGRGAVDCRARPDSLPSSRRMNDRSRLIGTESS